MVAALWSPESELVVVLELLVDVSLPWRLRIFLVASFSHDKDVFASPPDFANFFVNVHRNLVREFIFSPATPLSGKKVPIEMCWLLT